MKKNISIAVVLSIVFLRIVSQAQSDGRWFNNVSEPWWFDSPVYTEEEAALARTKWEQIGEEVRNSQDSEWVGTYIKATGELHNSYLRWSPKLGFVSMGIYTCAARVTNLNYGDVSFSPTLLQLSPEIPIRSLKSNGGHGSHSTQFVPDKYLPVKWGERRYLVAEKSVAAFYGYISGMGEVNEDFFVKLGDYEKPVEGMPILPPGYERYVKKPIETTIAAVGASYLKRIPTMDNSFFYESITPVRINAGRVNGVKRDMTFYVVGSKRLEKVELTWVGKSSAKGLITRYVDDNNKENYFNNYTRQWEEYPKIGVGWELTTSWLLSKQF